MSSPLSKYAFINAKLRARISKIVPDELFSQLAKAPSLDAALVLLRETPYGDLERTYAATGDLKQAERELLKNEIELYRNVRQLVHADCVELVTALLVQFEIDNLKNAIRVFFDRTVRRRPADAGEHYILYERIVHDIPVDLVVNASSFDEIAGVCEGTPYGTIIRKYGLTVESEGSLFRLELAFDHHYYQSLLSAIEKLARPDRAIALRLAGVEIDLQNIRWIIRFRQFYDLSLEAVMAAIVPGGFNLRGDLIEQMYRAQNVTTMLRGFVRSRYPALSMLLAAETTDTTSRLLLVRRVMEEIMKHEVQRILTGYPFTVGIILAYFLVKKRELNTLRTVLNAKQYGIAQERIEGLL